MTKQEKKVKTEEYSNYWKCSHGMVDIEGTSCPKCREKESLDYLLKKEETLNLLIEKLKELDAWRESVQAILEK